jgi:hypothetical protein
MFADDARQSISTPGTTLVLAVGIMEKAQSKLCSLTTCDLILCGFIPIIHPNALAGVLVGISHRALLRRLATECQVDVSKCFTSNTSIALYLYNVNLL